jgi:hypothetical protein
VKRRVSTCTHTDTKSTYAFIDISDKQTTCSGLDDSHETIDHAPQIELEVILTYTYWLEEDRSVGHVARIWTMRRGAVLESGVDSNALARFQWSQRVQLPVIEDV